MKRQMRMSKEVEVHMYYHELIIMKTDLLQNGAKEPFRIRSNLQIPRNAEIGVHLFTESLPFTEKFYILKQEWILDWVIDQELEKDILILETVSKEDFLKWCSLQIERKNNEIRKLLKEVEKLGNYRQLKYGVFDEDY